MKLVPLEMSAATKLVEADKAIAPLTDLTRSLKELFVSGKYTDLTITCGPDTHSVHKSVVCTRSDFFAKACDGHFREAISSEIDLDNDDPQLVKLMVHFLYHLDYPQVQVHSKKDESASTSNGTSKLEKKTPSTSKRLSHKGILGTSSNVNLSIHAEIYALAEKYGILSLKYCALNKFLTECQKHWQESDFTEASALAYENTLDSDRGLRDIVVSTLYQHPEVLTRDDCQQVIKRLPQISIDLFMLVQKKGQWPAIDRKTAGSSTSNGTGRSRGSGS